MAQPMPKEDRLSTRDNGATTKAATVKFKPTPIDIDATTEMRLVSRENSLKTPTTPIPSFSGQNPGPTPRDDGDLQHEKKKIGHRRVDKQTGEITYKKFPTSEIMGAIQLGITNSIGSLASKPTRDLLMQDFTVVETVYFPCEGSNVTPSHAYGDFRFKSYAPIAFRYFRALFNIKPEDFLASLTEPLRELSNPGASGSIFYISMDDQFIIKTVQHKEADFLQKLLPGYFMNLNQNPRTLLPKFFGLYCYQSLGKNVRLLAMNNLLPSSICLHHKFDLKGSTYKRKASKYERAKEFPTLKDLDFLEEYVEGISLEAPTYEALIKTICRDCRVLESFKIMDYSLLVGIHNIDQAVRDHEANLLDEQDGPVPFQANESHDNSNITTHKKIVRQKTAFSTWESIQADAAPVDLDEEYPTGGVPARNARGDRLLLFLGVIDILQSYQLFKKFEHAMKSVLHDGDTISVHRPSFYATRFQDFMKANVFKKTKSLDAPAVPGQPIRRFRSIVQSYLAFKHSPSKKRQRRGTSGSVDEKNHKSSISISDTPATNQRSSRSETFMTPSATLASPTSVLNSEVKNLNRKSITETPRITVQWQDMPEGHSLREPKKVERLFANADKRGSSSSAHQSEENASNKCDFDRSYKAPLETDL